MAAKGEPSQPVPSREAPGRRRASATRRASGRSSAPESGGGAASTSAGAAGRVGAGSGSTSDVVSHDRSPVRGCSSRDAGRASGRGATRLARQRERRPPPSSRAAKARRASVTAATASAGAIARGSGRDDCGGGSEGSTNGSAHRDRSGAVAEAAGAELPSKTEQLQQWAVDSVVAEVKSSTAKPSRIQQSSAIGRSDVLPTRTRCLGQRQTEPADGIDQPQQQPKHGETDDVNDDHVAGRAAAASSEELQHSQPEEARKSVGVLTDADCLGPCEPGTHVSLDGIVWQETANGVLVVNVTWRGKTYMGTLLDATTHDWAPPRLHCESPSGDFASRASKSSRIRRKPLLLSAALREDVSEQRKLLQKQHRGSSRGSSSSCRARRSQSRSSVAACGISEDRPTPAACKKRTKSPAVAADPATSDAGTRGNADGPAGVEISGPIAVKRRRSSFQSFEEPVSVAALSSAFLVCPEPGCTRKYRQASSLRHHIRKVHRCLMRRSDSGETAAEGDFASDERGLLAAAVGATHCRAALAACSGSPTSTDILSEATVAAATSAAAAKARVEMGDVDDRFTDLIAAPALTLHSGSVKANLQCDRALASISSRKAVDELSARALALAGLKDASPPAAAVLAHVAAAAPLLPPSSSAQPVRAATMLPLAAETPGVGGGAWRPGCEPIPACAASAAGSTSAITPAKGTADQKYRVPNATASPGAVRLGQTRQEVRSSSETWLAAASDVLRRSPSNCDGAGSHPDAVAKSNSEYAAGGVDSQESPAVPLAPVASVLPRAAAVRSAVRAAPAASADACSDVSDDGQPPEEPRDRPSLPGPADSPTACIAATSNVAVATKVRNDFEDWRCQRRSQQQQQQRHWLPPGGCSQFAYPVVAVSPRKADKEGEVTPGSSSCCIVPPVVVAAAAAAGGDRSCSPMRAAAIIADARHPASTNDRQQQLLPQPPKKTAHQPRREVPVEAAAVMRRSGSGVVRDADPTASFELYCRQQQQQMLLHANPFGMRYYHPWHGLPTSPFDDAAAAAAAATSFMHLMDWRAKPADRPHGLASLPPHLAVPFAAGSPQYGHLPFLPHHGRKSAPAEAGLRLPQPDVHASRYEVLKESIELKNEMSRLPSSPRACAPSPKREKQQQQLAATSLSVAVGNASAAASASAGSPRSALGGMSSPCDSKPSGLAQAASPLAADASYLRQQPVGATAASTFMPTPLRGSSSPRVDGRSSPTAGRFRPGVSCTAPLAADCSTIAGGERHAPQAVQDAQLQPLLPTSRADCVPPMQSPHPLLLFDEAALRSAAVVMQYGRSAAAAAAATSEVETVTVGSADEKRNVAAALSSFSASAGLVVPSELYHRRPATSSLSGATGKGTAASPLPNSASASLRRHHKAPELGDVAM